MALSALNWLARERMRQQLRLPSEFDAFVLDHFQDSLHLIPDGADRVAKENTLLRIHGARSVLAALGESSPWPRRLLRPRLALSIVALALTAWQLHRWGDPQINSQTQLPSIVQANALLPSAALPTHETSSAPNHEQRPAEEVPIVAPEPTRVSPPKAASVGLQGCRKAIGRAPFAAKRLPDGRLLVSGLPKGHGYQRGIQLALYGRLAGSTNFFSEIACVEVIEATERSLIADGRQVQTLDQRGPLCAGPMPERIRFARQWAKLLPQRPGEPMRINIGSGNGVRVGDRYLVKDESVSDADITGRSLGRQTTGVVQVKQVSTNFSDVELQQGHAPPSAYVQREITTMREK